MRSTSKQSAFRHNKGGGEQSTQQGRKSKRGQGNPDPNPAPPPSLLISLGEADIKSAAPALEDASERGYNETIKLMSARVYYKSRRQRKKVKRVPPRKPVKVFTPTAEDIESWRYNYHWGVSVAEIAKWTGVPPKAIRPYLKGIQQRPSKEVLYEEDLVARVNEWLQAPEASKRCQMAEAIKKIIAVTERLLQEAGSQKLVAEANDALRYYNKLTRGDDFFRRLSIEHEMVYAPNRGFRESLRHRLEMVTSAPSEDSDFIRMEWVDYMFRDWLVYDYKEIKFGVCQNCWKIYRKWKVTRKFCSDSCRALFNQGKKR